MEIEINQTPIINILQRIKIKLFLLFSNKGWTVQEKINIIKVSVSSGIAFTVDYQSPIMAKKRKELIADVKYTNRQRQKHFDVYISIKENQ